MDRIQNYGKNRELYAWRFWISRRSLPHIISFSLRTHDSLRKIEFYTKVDDIRWAGFSKKKARNKKRKLKMREKNDLMTT